MGSIRSIGGILILAVTYYANKNRANSVSKIVLAVTLFSLALLIAAQIPKVYVWIVLLSKYYTLPRAVFLLLHICVIALCYWGGMDLIRSAKRSNLINIRQQEN